MDRPADLFDVYVRMLKIYVRKLLALITDSQFTAVSLVVYLLIASTSAVNSKGIEAVEALKKKIGPSMEF